MGKRLEFPADRGVVYGLLLLMYTTLPATEIVLYGKTGEHSTAMLRKRVLDYNAVLGYFGEAYFYLWARRKTNLDAIGIVRTSQGRRHDFGRGVDQHRLLPPRTPHYNQSSSSHPNRWTRVHGSERPNFPDFSKFPPRSWPACLWFSTCSTDA